jgi:hypothetical protein
MEEHIFPGPWRSHVQACYLRRPDYSTFQSRVPGPPASSAAQP